MIASSTWKDSPASGSAYEGRTESGHTLTFEASSDHIAGPSPMETLLAALCACTSVDVVSILKKKRQQLTLLTVTATAEQAEEAPRVFTRIHLLYAAQGPTLSHKAVDDAVQLSKEKYCSVSIMLKCSVQLTHSIQVVTEPVA
jgi:putative redox protein